MDLELLDNQSCFATFMPRRNRKKGLESSTGSNPNCIGFVLQKSQHLSTEGMDFLPSKGWQINNATKDIGNAVA